MMDEYVQAILDAIWDIPGWPKKEIIDRRRVRQWIKSFPPEDNVDLLKAVQQFDQWCDDNPIGSGSNRSPGRKLSLWIENAASWGTAKPKERLQTLTVEEQLRLKDVKRKAQLERMGIRND